MNIRSVTITLLLLAVNLISIAYTQRDETLTPLAIGKDVTEAVMRKIASSEIFPDDHSFLIRLAYVESKFGSDDDTFRGNYTGGIWQVDEKVFIATRNMSLYPFHQAIWNKFQISWSDIQWTSCLAPMYSGLAAALYFAQNTTSPIPDKISEQADHWKKHWRPDGNKTEFIEDANELRNETVCRGKMDLAIILDGSGSIGESDFRKARNFVAEMIESFTLDFTRIGMILYSDNVRDIFQIQNEFSIAQMAYKARIVLQPFGGTNTDKAIFRAIEMHKNAGRIDGVPKLVAVLTDGKNTGKNLTGAVAEIAKNELISIAIGIGKGIDPEELKFIALNDTNRVFPVADFDALQDFLFQLTSFTCEIPQKPIVNGTYEDTLIANEKRLYEVLIPANGIFIDIDVTEGKTVGYWSRTERVPNSAIHDGIIDGSTYIPSAAHVTAYYNDAAASVYIAVQGVEPMNNYTFKTTEPNEPPPTIPTTQPPPESTPTETTTQSTGSSNAACIQIILFGFIAMIPISKFGIINI